MTAKQEWEKFRGTAWADWHEAKLRHDPRYQQIAAIARNMLLEFVVGLLAGAFVLAALWRPYRWLRWEAAIIILAVLGWKAFLWILARNIRRQHEAAAVEMTLGSPPEN